MPAVLSGAWSSSVPTASVTRSHVEALSAVFLCCPVPKGPGLPSAASPSGSLRHSHQTGGGDTSGSILHSPFCNVCAKPPPAATAAGPAHTEWHGRSQKASHYIASHPISTHCISALAKTAISCQSWALALCFARCDGQRDSTTSPFPEIEMDPVLPTSPRLSTAPAGPPRLPATATGVLPALQPHHTAYIWRIPLPHPSECNYTHGCGPLLMGKPPHTLQATNSIKETQFSLVVPHLVPQKALLMQRAVYFSLLDLN